MKRLASSVLLTMLMFGTLGIGGCQGLHREDITFTADPQMNGSVDVFWVSPAEFKTWANMDPTEYFLSRQPKELNALNDTNALAAANKPHMPPHMVHLFFANNGTDDRVQVISAAKQKELWDQWENQPGLPYLVIFAQLTVAEPQDRRLLLPLDKEAWKPTSPFFGWFSSPQPIQIRVLSTGMTSQTSPKYDYIVEMNKLKN